MAAMDQGKLNNMVNSINQKANDYVGNVTKAVQDLNEAFNTNWISESSKALAVEISECLKSLADNITSKFAAKNSEIKNAVSAFNSVEKENIHYSGFSFSKPKTTLSLNATLPNNKVGVAEGANLSDIETPMKWLIREVESSLVSIVNTINMADAFNSGEQQALTSAVISIKDKFVENMGELSNSLTSRMSSEIDLRNTLDEKSREALGNK